MITDFIFVIGAVIIQMFAGVLGVLNWSLPIPILNGLDVVFQIINFWGQFLPWIGDFIAIVLILVPTYVIRYVFDILLWIWSLVPWIGHSTEIPSGSKIIIRERSSSIQEKNELDLRTARRKRKTIRDVQWPN